MRPAAIPAAMRLRRSLSAATLIVGVITASILSGLVILS
jgi:hypothetical protein